MVDYRKFLGAAAKEPVLYLGGSVAYGEAAPMRLRAPVEVEPGFFFASRAGRFAELHAEEPATRLAWAGEPRSVGHYASGYVALEGSRFARVMQLGEAEPDVLSKVRVVHHVSGVTIFEEALFDEEAEFEAREALLGDRVLANVRGISPTLRAAFGWALLSRVAASRAALVSPVEALGAIPDIAERGRSAAGELLEALTIRRAVRRARNEEREALAAAPCDGLPADADGPTEADEEPAEVHAPVWPQHRGRGSRRARVELLSSEERARDVFAYCEKALRAAGATLDHVRDVSGPRRHARRGAPRPATIEVRFRFLGETFITVVDGSTLQVHDAGVCLDGSDDALTLESLPSAIREAHDTGRLVITRRP